MTHLNQHKTGLVVGVLIGAWHLAWSALVWTGWGQPLIDFILWAHMIHLQYVVGPFDAKASALLVVVTALAGYALGWLFALVWNRVHAANT